VDFIIKWAPIFTFVGAIFSLSAIVLAFCFQKLSKRDYKQTYQILEEMRQKLRSALDEYNKNFQEFLQLQGLRTYFRQALDLYKEANTRVISMAKVWFVSSELASILEAMATNTKLQIDFCGPAKLEHYLFPPLLWRLHLMYVKNKANSSHIRFWASEELPIRFTISDDNILIAGTAPADVSEETIGWRRRESDKKAADLYATIFNDKIKPYCRGAEEALISELKTKFKSSISIQTVINDLVAGVYQKLYEPNPHRTKWGQYITAVDFEIMLDAWLRSLPNRHPSLVTITGNEIEFK
jgi:hypothetical protein